MNNEDTVKAILQINGKLSNQFNALLRNHAVRVKHNFRNLDTLSIELPKSVVDQLESFSEVVYVSVDAEVKSFGHVTETTGTEAMRTQRTTTLLGGTTTTTLDGTGIGIAVLDSGIDAGHTSFLDKSNGKRVAFSKDFTGENRTDDPYGHGTHVASTAAGNGRIANGAYTGIAPNAKIVNLRVLNARGTGNISSVLSALDWVLANRPAYNIRVVNMSLGMPVADSYRNDPICKAVRKLVDAGVVVVAAAGNNGKDSDGRKIYGA
ncbi:MAG TPA: S8 family serine peptidase, partial [Pyrinomonadaceae bacterium]|nr:S8 family serine peptidase [Pyrinomonadaceae bacterium]